MERSAGKPESPQALLAGRYELKRLMASGGMGDVWHARHVALDRDVAVKLLRDDVEQRAERLLIEARTLAKLRHPAIVEVFDCGIAEDGAPYIAMELLQGKTLAAQLATGSGLGAVGATRLLLPVLSGLTAVHAAGVIHRDLKPENIMLTPGPIGVSPKLIDFGIARIGSKVASRLTETGSFVGTPQYMAPEQLLGSAGDVRSDVWGITAVLYETICGKSPFDAPDVAGVFHAIAYDPPPFPAEVRDLDGKMWAVLVRGLRKRPEERFQSCAELAEALSSWLSHPARSSAVVGDPLAPSPTMTETSRLAPTLDSAETALDELIRRKKGSS